MLPECIKVRLRKLEYGEKVIIFFVTYYKKWNLNILDSLHVK